MTTNQKQPTLSELINDSGIYTAIETLESNLRSYQYSERAAPNRYLIQIELIELQKELTIVKHHLEDLGKLQALE